MTVRHIKIMMLSDKFFCILAYVRRIIINSITFSIHVGMVISFQGNRT